MDPDGNWFAPTGEIVDYKYIWPCPTFDDAAYNSIWTNPTVTGTDQALWILGLAVPCAIGFLAFVAGLIHLVGKKRDGQPLTPFWILSLWKKVKGMKGFRGSKELRMKELDSTSHSEV